MARSAFRFRLQKLLDIRRTREQLEQQKLLVVQQALAREEQKLAELHEREQELVDKMNPTPGQTMNLEERWACERFLVEHRKVITTQGWNVDEAKQKVAAQAELLRQAGIDVKVLEKLEEKQREEHRLEQLAAEAVFLDDISSQGYMRQRNHAELVATEEHDRALAADQEAG